MQSPTQQLAVSQSQKDVWEVPVKAADQDAPVSNGWGIYDKTAEKEAVWADGAVQVLTITWCDP